MPHGAKPPSTMLKQQWSINRSGGLQVTWRYLFLRWSLDFFVERFVSRVLFWTNQNNKNMSQKKHLDQKSTPSFCPQNSQKNTHTHTHTHTHKKKKKKIPPVSIPSICHSNQLSSFLVFPSFLTKLNRSKGAELMTLEDESINRMRYPSWEQKHISPYQMGNFESMMLLFVYRVGYVFVFQGGYTNTPTPTWTKRSFEDVHMSQGLNSLYWGWPSHQ